MSSERTTISSFLEAYLTENGLFPDEAHEVAERYKASTDADMQHRWGDSIEGYPKPMLAVPLISVRRAAIEWMDEKKPLHWARGMFEAAA